MRSYVEDGWGKGDTGHFYGYLHWGEMWLYEEDWVVLKKEGFSRKGLTRVYVGVWGLCALCVAARWEGLGVQCYGMKGVYGAGEELHCLGYGCVADHHLLGDDLA